MFFFKWEEVLVKKKCLLLFFLLIATLLLQPVAMADKKDITLPHRPSAIGMDLFSALENRKTSREYTSAKLTPQDLSAILWAANGVNRPYEYRTAPSAFGNAYIDIYVAADEGVYLYDAPKHRLKFVAATNVKSLLSGQRHVAAASHVLILVADIEKLPVMITEETRLHWAHATAGAVAQNVYLACAAKRIGTCFVGGISEKEIRATLGLQEKVIPLYVMPLGYEKK
jgi:SagB-type dehydrogenase family enzyme